MIAEGSTVHAVLACLANGERLETGVFGSIEEAEEQVAELTRQLERDDSSPWPQFGSTFVRPSSIVALQIAEQPRRTWAGSTQRSKWADDATRQRRASRIACRTLAASRNIDARNVTRFGGASTTTAGVLFSS
jgi:hypothetical protein